MSHALAQTHQSRQSESSENWLVLDDIFTAADVNPLVRKAIEEIKDEEIDRAYHRSGLRIGQRFIHLLSERQQILLTQEVNKELMSPAL